MTVFSSAMVLAAGKGKRMGALSADRPKPLVPVAGRTLLDRILDHLKATGVKRAVVNMHHFASKMVEHLGPEINSGYVQLSDERDALLETGGGVKKALPLLGPDPFFVINGDALWVNNDVDNLESLQQAFDPAVMDILLLLAPRNEALGYDGAGDFIGANAVSNSVVSFPLVFRGTAVAAPYVFAGVQIIRPEMYADTPEGSWSNVELFRKAAEQGRLYGLVIDGSWMHVGTPQAVLDAEEKLRELGAP